MMRKLVLLLFLFLPLAARAENLDLKYEASWSGISAGTAEVIINESGGNYSDRVRADAVGLVKDFTNYWTDSTVNGAISGGKYQPAVFDSKWQPKKAPVQNVVVTYGMDGTVSEVANPPENRGKHPQVAEQDKHGLPDPISAGMIARHRVREIIESGTQLPQSFALRIFDGRRVTDLNLSIQGYEEVKIDDRKQKLLKIIFTRTAVTGYNKKELELLAKNPAIPIYADENYIPVLATGQSVIGEVSIKLINVPRPNATAFSDGTAASARR